MFGLFRRENKPCGLKWRSSVWFVTLVVGYGVATDLTVYSVIIPVVPFQLEKLGYTSASALTAWLLFAYSIALVLFSPVCSWFSEKYRMRQAPLLWGLFSLMGFLVMFMEAPNYAVMVVARFVQGISSSVIWVIGLALLADTVPAEKLGPDRVASHSEQLGLAMTGLTVGMLAAPPIGGVLYDRLGFRAPFIFGIILTAVDFVGRLLIIERKDALSWGYDPAPSPENTVTEAQPTDHPICDVEAKASGETIAQTNEKKEEKEAVPPVDNTAPRKLPELQVWKFMLTSRRTMVGLSSIFLYGVVYTGLEPTLSLRLQDVYGFNSTKVGLVILASAVAAVFASPISGWISDRFGVEWITFICLTLTIPWYALLIIRGCLAFFIACFALANFMMAALVSPLIAELASVVRRVDGIGFGHIYGFFNMTFGVGSAVGPIVAGQVYSHAKDGWTILLGYGSGLLLLCSFVNFFFGGERPLVSRLKSRSTNTNVAQVI